MVEQVFQKKVSGVQSIYLPKLKGLLYKWVDKDKMNSIGRLYYLLTNWLAYLYGRTQSPRPDVMPDRREGKGGGWGSF